MKLAKIIVGLVLVSAPTLMSAQTIDLDDIDIHAVTYCKKTELFCQIEREKTKLLVQALLVQILEAQQSGYGKSEPHHSQDYRDQLKENPLSAGQSKSFRVHDGLAEIDSDDHAVYQETWRIFQTITPHKYLQDFEKIVFINDEKEYFAALVEQEIVQIANKESERWVLRVNLDQLEMGSNKEYQKVVEVIAHEAGHVLALNREQLDFFVDKNDCREFYVADMDSCAEHDSYFNALALYWPTHMRWFEEYADLFQSNRDRAEEALVDYYQDNKHEFVSEYAASSYHEDLAETMAHFAVDPVPTGALTVAEEKILELYDFPQMLEYRRQVQSLLP